MVPLFFDDLGLEHHGIEGAELGAHLSFPKPSIGLGQAMRLFTQLKEFFTTKDGLLDEQVFTASGIVPSLTAGPLYLQLPSYAGGQLLGSRTATSTVSPGEGLAHLLNGLKGLRFDELFAAIPAAMLQGPPSPAPHVELGPLSFASEWHAGTPDGARRGVAVHVAGNAGLGPYAGLHGSLDVTSAGAGSVGLGFTVDGAISRLLGVHIDGALETGALVRGPGASALVLSDPSARALLPLPAFAPAAFTVEWWLCPATVRDYDQTVSGADRWGSFVFHTTASGAVYCGTDGDTRLTPNELPPGTVRTNVWQHPRSRSNGARHGSTATARCWRARPG